MPSSLAARGRVACSCIKARCKAPRPACSRALRGATVPGGASGAPGAGTGALGLLARLAEVDDTGGDLGDAEIEIVRVQHRTLGHDDGALHAILQLAHVAGPGVAGERRQRVGIEALDAAPVLGVEAVQKGVR